MGVWVSASNSRYKLSFPSITTDKTRLRQCYNSYTVRVNKTVTFSFRSVLFERCPLLHVRCSVSVLLARANAIIYWACFADLTKI